jgi:DNA modification methylase
MDRGSATGINSQKVKAYFHSSEKMSELEDESVQFCITSTSAWEPFEAAIPEIYRVLKPDGVFIFNMGQVPVGSGAWERFKKEGNESAMPLLPSIVASWVLELAPFRMEEDLIQVNDFGIKPRRWICSYEHFFLYAKKPDYFMNAGEDTPAASWRYACPQVPSKMPFSFYPEILEYFMAIFTRQGDTVLDPLAGKGIVGKVARKMDRGCVLYEIDRSLENAIMENLGMTIAA